ncbi:uncharacterized protein EURHEDRAFT_302370 [Aspergillus ruber CBS 135680]|uniref:Uncharacterized protein n=1 Tax=Aspergillus ruber (strain CBS 135680) TaxID=1388766 RepID=A0A017SL30_ASPRC|nr:uncharacterized protein EURHEDRAFT_302370 [Aspergillus ruber CBS 135680]EYE97673.1 hypothetical protein EURHEDRAFT_302370 [Aspergillus ruber CBS 135680]
MLDECLRDEYCWFENRNSMRGETSRMPGVDQARPAFTCPICKKTNLPTNILPCCRVVCIAYTLALTFYLSNRAIFCLGIMVAGSISSKRRLLLHAQGQRLATQDTPQMHL